MPSRSAGAARAGRLTVLLVDDNAGMRAFVRSLVEEVTPVVYEAEDGESALDAYSRLRPDWVLMDIEMPGMDGIATTRAMRRMDPEARVVIVTGHGEEPYRRAAAEAGATAFVLKEDLLDLPPMLMGATLDPPV
jgi:CheY-like chemotaxis protein